MYHLISTSTINIGSAKACELLKLNRFEGQRPLRRADVVRYLDLMRNGRFVKGNIATVKANGNHLLMNGQHQLQAISEYDGTIKITLDEYEADTHEDVYMLFATFDVHRGRTERHVIHAARPMFSDERLKMVPLAALASFGGALWQCSFDPIAVLRTSPTKTTKVELIVQHAEEVIGAWQMLAENGLGEKDLNLPIATAIIATRRVGGNRAADFWIPVMTATGLVKDSPQWKLHRYLSSSVMIGKGRVQQFSIVAVAISWWNAWAAGEARVSVKVASMKTIPHPVKPKGAT